MGYTRAQIILHWLIAVLVLVQWLTHEAMEDAFEVVEDGRQALPDFGAGSLVHAIGGALVLLLLLVRFGLRLRYGAPPAPADLATPFQLLAKVTHWAFYIVLLLLPVSGVSSILVNQEAAGAHGFLFNILLLLLFLHVAAVAFHTFVMRDDVLKRMLVPGEKSPIG